MPPATLSLPGGNGTNQILRITPDLKVEPFVTDFEGHAFLGPNDLAIHASGHIFFSDPGTFVTAESNGGFYRSDFEGHTISVAENLGFPNGVAVIGGWASYICGGNAYRSRESVRRYGRRALS